MKFLKNTLIISLVSLIFLINKTALSEDFLYGNFNGVSFKIERGNVTFSDKKLYKFKSNATIKKIGKNKIEMVVKASVQMSQNSPLKKQTKEDKFDIVWKNSKSGFLLNKNSKYIKDKSSFNINGKILEIKSWIDRHQSTETQVYKLIN